MADADGAAHRGRDRRDGEQMKIIYARGFPYGAPLVMLRGGAFKDPVVRDAVKSEGFGWDGRLFAWKHYLYTDDLRAVLRKLRDAGCEVVPKSDLAPEYVIDLDAEEVGL